MGENPLFLKSKVKVMEISKETRAAVKPACWGAAGGAIALAIIWFTWGGWVTGGTAKTLGDAAVTAALVPICADKFQAVGALALSTLDPRNKVPLGSNSATGLIRTSASCVTAERNGEI